MQYPKKHVLPKSIEICMKTPWWCPSGWAPTWRTKTIVTEFCYKSVNLFPEVLINVSVKLFLIHELFRCQNFLKYVTFLTYMT